MATVKIFDNADLLKFFAESSTVGRFTVIQPSKTLFGETETTRYPIGAKTEALWCEKYALAFVVQSVVFENGGWTHLAKDHPLRQKPTVHVRYGSGQGSGELGRWAADLSDAWRETVKMWLPNEPLDFTKPQWATVAIRSEIDEDHTPTGQSVDDMFDDGEVQA